MKNKFFKHSASYSSIRSSILACVGVIVSIANIKLSYWWQYLLALIGLILVYYYVLDFLLYWLDYLFFFKFAKADIAMDNEEYTEKLLGYIDELHQATVLYDTFSSPNWEKIEVHRMKSLYTKASLVTKGLIQANSGPITFQNQAKYDGVLIEHIQSYLDEIFEHYHFLTEK